MSDDQVREWAREAGEYALKHYKPHGPLAYAYRNVRDAHFARLARAEAYEAAAARECEDMARRSYSNTAVLIAAAENIRAFAEREKETGS